MEIVSAVIEVAFVISIVYSFHVVHKRIDKLEGK